ncbi:MAG TPA: methyltransferase domain-containing protein [Vicinamibacterales bacterium]|jgi:phosphatidylethanolamine/phosphatidyl-N-methylethanolamine N-methyltransferase|nr:methyltransferase domain-containing protein [Vicinamibacterales bacterium]
MEIAAGTCREGPGHVRGSHRRLQCAEGRRLKTVEAIYERLAPIYDLIYGVTLEPGRRRAMARLAPAGGESILEIGVGTGLSAMAYPPSCRVVAIDLSAQMLERARVRLARYGVHHVALCRMDASRLAFPDACFDAIYAAYVMNVVRDPVTVARDMIRVCRPSGRIVLLNHFDHPDGSHGALDAFLGRLASRAGVDWHIDLLAFLHAAGLTPLSIERVNVPRISSVVVCHKPKQPTMDC